MWHERAKGRTQEQAAARSGMSVRTARVYERRGKLPSQLKQPRTYRSRPNPFADDWPWLVALLEQDPALQGQTLFGLLCAGVIDFCPPSCWPPASWPPCS